MPPLHRDALAALEPSNNRGYGRKPLPTIRDDEIAVLLHQLVSQNSISSLEPQHGIVLAAYAERMASLAVRTGSSELIRDGLVAIQLALKSGDQRESMPVLSLLSRAAELIGSTPSEEFLAAARYMSLTPSDQLISFLERNEDDRSLAAMGFVESSDEQGFRFERVW